MPDKPASKTEIAVALGVLFNATRPATGIKANDRLEGYLVALAEFPLAAIETAIRKLLRNEIAGINKGFCPYPNELASVVRKAALGDDAPEIRKSKLYRYRQPRSAVLETNVSKAWAMQLINNGVHPHGSIWCPGSFNDHPEFGMLYAPDPMWEPAVPIDARREETRAERWEQPAVPIDEARRRVRALLENAGFGSSTGRRIRGDDARLHVPPEERPIPDYSKEKLDVSPALLKSLGVDVDRAKQAVKARKRKAVDADTEKYANTL